jgi:hypothetical protein
MGILTDDMKRVVSEQRLGFYATVCPDGTPNLSPKGTTAVWDDDHIVFADLRSPQTIANIQQSSPSIEVNVVDPIVRKGYRFKGTARVLTDGETYEGILEMFERERNVERSRIKAVVLIEVTQARPLISPAYDWGMTEEEVAADWKQRFADLYGSF